MPWRPGRNGYGAHKRRWTKLMVTRKDGACNHRKESDNGVQDSARHSEFSFGVVDAETRRPALKFQLP